MLPRAATLTKCTKWYTTTSKHTLGNQRTHHTCKYAHKPTHNLRTYNMHQQLAKITAKDWYDPKDSHAHKLQQRGTLQLQIISWVTRGHTPPVDTPTSPHSTSAHPTCSKSYIRLQQMIATLLRAAMQRNHNKGVPFHFKYTLGNQRTHPTSRHAQKPTSTSAHTTCINS